MPVVLVPLFWGSSVDIFWNFFLWSLGGVGVENAKIWGPSLKNGNAGFNGYGWVGPILPKKCTRPSAEGLTSISL
jgi:hypothetical protein